jgi:hypothetical protein
MSHLIMLDSHQLKPGRPTVVAVLCFRLAPSVNLGNQQVGKPMFPLVILSLVCFALRFDRGRGRDIRSVHILKGWGVLPRGQKPPYLTYLGAG